MEIALLYVLTGARYQAKVKIMVRRVRADVVASAGENAPIDIAHMATTEEDLNSEVELLKDDEILRKVVEANHLAGRDWLHFLRLSEGRTAQIERAARQLSGRLRVEPLKKTNLIAASYESRDPVAAAKVLQSLATLYLEKPWRFTGPSVSFRTNAMIFVLPSDMEGLSLALLDAMGAGLCVLTSDVPENREVVDGAGFTFE